MKPLLSLLAIVVLAGCSHSPAPKPPENYTITETSHECNGNSCRIVTRTILPSEEIPRTQGQMVGVVELGPPPPAGEDDNPYAEEERNETLLKAMKEAVERDTPCKCQAGDPLCDCLPKE